MDHLDGFRIVEVTKRGIDKREVTILSDSQDSKIRRILFQKFGVAFCFFGAVLCIATQAMKLTERDFIHESIDQEFPERLGRVVVHAEIFIEMKSSHARPVDVGRLRETREKLILRRR